MAEDFSTDNERNYLDGTYDAGPHEGVGSVDYLASLGFTEARDIDAGSMGSVWVCRWQDSQVAVKLPRAGLEKRLLQEATNLRKLKHVGIVKHLKSCNDGHFLAMEYLEGPRLRDASIQEWSVETIVRQLLRPLAKAIEHCHAHGVVHRDVSYNNVLLTPDRPMLIDFGLSVEPTDSMRMTHTGDRLGTRQFISPEQMAESKHVGSPTDIYALGVVAFWALLGRTPFAEGLTYDELARKKDIGELDGVGALRQLAGESLARIVLNMLHPEPDSRLTGAQVIEELSSWLEDRPTSAQGISAWNRGLRRLTPYRWYLAGGIMLVCVAVGAWLFVRSANDGRADAQAALNVERDERVAAAEEHIRQLLQEMQPAIRNNPVRIVEGADYFLARFKALREDTPYASLSLRSRLAIVAWKAGDLHANPGDYNAANPDIGLQLYSWAIAEYEDLHQEHAEDELIHRYLGMVLGKRGRLLRVLGRTSDSWADLTRSREIREKHLSDTNANTYLQLAVAEDDIGDFEKKSGDLKAAWDKFLAALRLRERSRGLPVPQGEVLMDDPSNAIEISYRNLEQIAATTGWEVPKRKQLPPEGDRVKTPRPASRFSRRFNTSLNLMHQGKYNAALSEIEEAVQVLKEIGDADTLPGSLRQWYGRGWLHQSRIRRMMGNWVGAASDLNEAEKILTTAPKETPNRWWHLGEFHLEQGIQLAHAGERDDALKAWDSAISCFEECPPDPALKTLCLSADEERAKVLVRLGRPTEAVKILERIVPLSDNLIGTADEPGLLAPHYPVNLRILLTTALWHAASASTEPDAKISLMKQAQATILKATAKLESSRISDTVRRQTRAVIDRDYTPLLSIGRTGDIEADE